MATRERPAVGDEITIAGSGSAASPNLRGEVLEILGDRDRELLRVRWVDGHESIVPETVAARIARSRVAPATIFMLGSPANEASGRLVDSWRGSGLDVRFASGREALEAARSNDTVVGRLDVLPTLDGVEPGLLTLLLLARRGVRVLNTAESLVAAHDKLRAARLLAAAGVPHPRTAALGPHDGGCPIEPPCVVKPRFGSWGRDVVRCENEAAVRACLDGLRDRPWFRRHGALIQELLPPSGRDLRVVVAAGRVVGAAERVAAAGEWRTNVSLGGSLRPTCIDEDTGELARSAAAAIGADFVGIDLMPVGGAGHVVLELNGAVDFDASYSLAGGDVFLDVARALRLSHGSAEA